MAQQIELADGHFTSIENPYIKVENIAAQLSKICRFTGACRHFYSVAEHSVIVSLLMEEKGYGDPMEGLMHDACESIIGDMASPWKPLFPEYVEAEQHVDMAVRAQFDLPVSKTKGCHDADQIVGFIEAHLLMPSGGEEWPNPHGYREIAQSLIDEGWKTVNLTHQEAEKAFLKRWEQLSP